MTAPRGICLMGPTASGKTGLSIARAQALIRRGQAVEIISVDSVQVYRGLDIGTAKPDLTERAGIVHHLIDIRDPAQPYSAAAFRHDAGALLESVAARGALALLVGGTMLYFKALVEGLAPLPEADPAVRAEIAALAEREGCHLLDI